MRFAELIPNVFYDLIARVIPGGLALIGIGLALRVDVGSLLVYPFSSLDPLKSSLLFLVSLLLATSWLMGHLLWPLCSLFQRKVVKKIGRFRPWFHVLRHAIHDQEAGYPLDLQVFLARELGYEDLESARNANGMRYSPVLYIWADWLRLVDPAVGARLVKLRAEHRMHAGIATAGLLTLLLHLLAAVSGVVSFSVLLSGVSLVIVLVSMRNLAWAFRIFQWSVLNHFYAEKAIGRPQGAV